MIINILTLVLLVIILIVFSLSTYLMYFKRWKQFDPENLITFPEEAVAQIEEIKKTNIELQEKLNEQNKSLINEVNKILEQINNQFSSLNEQVQSFRTLAEERGIELKQYKDGYNYSIVKSFIMGLIENIKYIDKNLLRDEIKNSDFARYLEASKDKLELLLVAQGVEKYTPEIDKPIMETEGCKAVGTVPTSEDSQVNFIQSIITPGYKLQLNKNESNIIYDAEVIVFKKEDINE